MPIPFTWLHLAGGHLKNIWSEIEMMNGDLYWIVRSESETKLPQCGSNFTRSWLPCEVKSASAGWWVRFWRAGIEHESLYIRKVIFVAQSKLIFLLENFYFHAFGQMCLSEVLCYMMLKIGGPWHKSQQLTHLQSVSEAHAACTFLWDQQHSLLSKWLGGLWSIDWLNLRTWRTSDVK